MIKLFNFKKNYWDCIQFIITNIFSIIFLNFSIYCLGHVSLGRMCGCCDDLNGGDIWY